jgi:hypothetical protein
VDDGIDGIDRDGAGARRSSVALGSKPAAAAISLRRTIWMVGRLSVLTMPSSRWPRAAARVSVAPDICAKSALPEITALAEPMPVITTLLTFCPCLANRPRSSAR